MGKNSNKKQKLNRQKYLNRLKKAQNKKQLEEERKLKEQQVAPTEKVTQMKIKNSKKETAKETFIRILTIVLTVVVFVSFVGGVGFYFYRKDLVKDKLFNSKLLAVQNGSKWGYVDKYGKTKINFNYDYAFNFADNGLALVCSGDKYYYINNKGEAVTADKYEKAISYNEHNIAICKKDGYYGAINSKGKAVIPFGYSNIHPFVGDYAIAEKNDKFGIIDKDGNIIVDVRYDNIESINSVYFKYEDAGRIKLATIDPESEFASKVALFNYANYTLLDNGYCIIKENEYYGFINDEGKLISEAKYMRLDYAGEEYFSFSMNGLLYGYLNLRGKVVLEDKYRYVSAFSDGVAVVRYTNTEEHIVIDKKGNEEFRFTASSIGKFVNGKAIFKKDSLYGVIDKNGSVVCEAKYRFISNFYDDNYAVVRDKNDLYGVITARGKDKITPAFTNVSIKELSD